MGATIWFDRIFMHPLKGTLSREKVIH